MDKTESTLKGFVESFFNNLGCVLQKKEETFHISGVPAEFEMLYGKKGPYVITFDPAATQGELVSRGSFLLKIITSYLEQRGQTAIVKLAFDHDYLAAFKRSFSFKKCELVSLTKKALYRPIYIFSFGTTLQYINEKEQVMNSIAIHNGSVLPFNLDQYNHEPGNPRELDTSGVRESYGAAREALKKLIEPRITDISEVLSQKIARESERIRGHYQQRLGEKEHTLVKLKEQLTTLDKTSPLPPAMAQRRERLVENLRLLEDSHFESALKEEQEFFIRDEEFKHALNVSTKLVSTTIAYYPVFIFTLTIKNRDVVRTLTIPYNTFSNDFEKPLLCEGCQHSIREIFLCGSAHVICTNCFDSCRTCERGMCSLCVRKTCTQCARKQCKQCVARCTLCWQDVCKTHLRTNYATGTQGCTSCLHACARCGVFADTRHRSRDLEGRELCQKCATLSKVSFTR